MSHPKRKFRYTLPVKVCVDPAQQILAAVAAEEAAGGKATTRTIATRVTLSESQVWRYLRRLEQSGCIRRIGQRGGWCLEHNSPCQTPIEQPE